MSLVEDKFYKYQVQIEEKEAILSKVKERMKNLYESEDLSDWKQMVELKESTKKEMSSIEVFYMARLACVTNSIKYRSPPFYKYCI